MFVLKISKNLNSILPIKCKNLANIEKFKPLRYVTTNVEKANQLAEGNSSKVVAKFDEPNNDSEPTEFDTLATTPELEEAVEREENFKKKVEELRDVSRFKKLNALKKHREQELVLCSLQEHYLKKPDFYRRQYARLGKSSGIEPGLIWPHKEELKTMIKEEKEFDLQLDDKIKILIERKTLKHESLKKLEKETDEALSKMPKQIESYFQRMVKKNKAEEDKLNKKKELLDQAREFYGFEVEMRDGRVQETLKRFQDEKKASEKLKKKEEEKQRKITSSLQQKLKEGEKALAKEQSTDEKSTNETKSKEKTNKAVNKKTTSRANNIKDSKPKVETST